MIVVGIDPGKTGGIVRLRSDDWLHVAAFRAEDTILVGRGGDYRVKAMCALLRDLAPELVVLEKQQAMPPKVHGRVQGVASTASIMRAMGLWEGVLGALEVPHVLVRPQVWQRRILAGAPGEGKARAIAVAERRLPGLNLTPGRCTKPHEGLADAACLALWGLETRGVEDGERG